MNLMLAMAMAGALEGTMNVNTQVIEAVTTQVGDSGRVVEYFEAPMDLIGARVELHQGGTEVILYASPDGRYLFFGLLMDTSTQSNVALEHRKGQRMVGGLWRDLAAAHTVIQNPGASAHPVYIVADLRCQYCHVAMQRLAEHREAAEIRWLLVGFQGPKSAEEADYILGVQDPVVQMALLEKVLLHGQALPTADAPALIAAGRARREANEALIEQWGLYGTPQLIAMVGGQPEVYPGAPSSELLGRLLPVPANK